MLSEKERDMNKEALMKKVEKLLSLAGNNPSQEEAQSAMAKAQKLIVEHNLDMSKLKSDEREDIVVVRCEHPNNNGYRVTLASILSENFRCKVLMVGNKVNFIGYKTDAEVCKRVFEYAYKTARREGQKKEREARMLTGTGKGVFNAFVSGFCAGVKKVLDEQCRALMIVTPQEVIDKLNNRATGTYRGGMKNHGSDMEAYISGKKTGEAHMRSRQLEGGC